MMELSLMFRDLSFKVIAGVITPFIIYLAAKIWLRLMKSRFRDEKILMERAKLGVDIGNVPSVQLDFSEQKNNSSTLRTYTSKAMFFFVSYNENRQIDGTLVISRNRRLKPSSRRFTLVLGNQTFQQITGDLPFKTMTEWQGRYFTHLEGMPGSRPTGYVDGMVGYFDHGANFSDFDPYSVAKVTSDEIDLRRMRAGLVPNAIGEGVPFTLDNKENLIPSDYDLFELCFI